MKSTYDTHEMNRALAVFSSRLGTKEIKEGTFLYALADVLLGESSKAISTMSSKLNNLHIETADADNVKYFANDLGLPRIEIPFMSVLSSENIAYIESPDGGVFPAFLDGTVVLKKGETLQNGKITITATEDFIIDSTKSKVFVSCKMSSSESSIFSKTSELRIDFFNSYMKYVLFKVSQDVVFTYVTETTSMLKNRIILERRSEGKRTPEFLKAYFEGIGGIKSVTIEDDILYFTTNDMFDYGDESNSELYKRIILSELSRLVPWPFSYKVKKRDKATLVVKYRVNESRTSTPEKMNDELEFLFRSVLSIGTTIDVAKIVNMIRIRTGDIIYIDEMYLIDSIVDSKIYDWTSVNDIYIYVDSDYLTEV